MNLKCFYCITDEWATMQRGDTKPNDAAANAADAVTIRNGTALCPDHAVNAHDLAEPEPPAVPRRLR